MHLYVSSLVSSKLLSAFRVIIRLTPTGTQERRAGPWRQLHLVQLLKALSKNDNLGFSDMHHVIDKNIFLSLFCAIKFLTSVTSDAVSQVLIVN